jgi:hypothetical protein
MPQEIKVEEEPVQGQSGLHRETLSQKPKENKEKESHDKQSLKIQEDCLSPAPNPILKSPPNLTANF